MTERIKEIKKNGRTMISEIMISGEDIEWNL